MTEVVGKYNTAKVFSDTMEEEAYKQILNMMNQEWIKDSKIRIMPDVHAGAGCTIGTTMTIKDKICPNLVGVDIGCSIYVVQFSKDLPIDFDKLDSVIRERVPFGRDVRKKTSKYCREVNLKDLKYKANLDEIFAMGSLGGGNHYIELAKNDKDEYFLEIHSGSRHLGKCVAEYYQKIAWTHLNDNSKEKAKIINELKAQGKDSEIQSTLNSLKLSEVKCDKDLAYVQGEDFNNYLHDMKICQTFAHYNRLTMADEIIQGMNWQSYIVDQFETMHNYIDLDKMILRKGSTSAQKGEKLIIPMNMRDGSLICIGKGNEDWNCSAPHGAGRIMSRSRAKEILKMEDFENTMKGIYTTCVNTSTIDESPMAYKPMDEIISNVKDTVDIVDIIKPVYNFKASD